MKIAIQKAIYKSFFLYNIKKQSYNSLGDLMKKIFQFIGIITLTIGSFIYTEKVAMTAKQTDSLLNEIKSKKDGYKENAIEPIIKENTIIPGVNGKEINTQKSYENMTKVGYFNDKLLEYKILKVENKLDKNKDKYIINGNNTKNEIALIFKIKSDDDITNISTILKKNNVKATFFVNSNYLEKNHNQIIELANQGHTIGNLSNNDDYNYSDFAWINTIITNIGKQKYNYCFTLKPNKKILNICKLYNSYTIMPQTIIKKNPFVNLKKQMISQNMIAFALTPSLNEQMSLIINYVLSKGYNLVSLETLLKE